MAIVLITHDLGVVARMADEVAVMYAGEIVEHGTRRRHVLLGRASLHGRACAPRCRARDTSRAQARSRSKARRRICSRRRRAAPTSRAARTRCALREPASAAVRRGPAPQRALLAAPRRRARRGRRCSAEASNGGADRGTRAHEALHDWPRARVVHAVDGVSLAIAEREVVGLVGESGSGKSTFGRTLVGLHDKTAGEVLFAASACPRSTRPPTSGAIASADADDLSGSVLEPEPAHDRRRDHRRGASHLTAASDARRFASAVGDWLVRVGLERGHASRYPHEFSGGQRQRVGIARALIMKPKFVVCDEPISALDVSVQAQIVRLLGELKASLGLTMLFIAHDLSMVRYVSDRMAVMYLGSLVEIGAADDVYFRPKHPYTEILVASNPAGRSAHGADAARPSRSRARSRRRSTSARVAGSRRAARKSWTCAAA